MCVLTFGEECLIINILHIYQKGGVNMKKKATLTAYIVLSLVLLHLILVVGCGKNPLLGIIGSSTAVGVGRM